MIPIETPANFSASPYPAPSVEGRGCGGGEAYPRSLILTTEQRRRRGDEPKVFYGWILVALAFLLQFVAGGTLFQSFPVFLLPFSEEFGIGRAEAALPPVAMMLSGMVSSPLIGLALSRFPIRNVMLMGALGMALGFFALSRSTEYWQVLVIYALIGPAAMGALGTLACSSLIVNWFEQKRAMAVGVAMIGLSISGAFMIPAATWGVENWGWRGVFEAFSLAGLALIPLIAWLVVTRPSDMGLTPDGDVLVSSATATAEVDAPTPSSLRSLLASPSLWLIGAACGLAYMGALPVMNHGIAFAIDRGIDPMRAAALLSAISLGAATGKVVFGWLSDHLGEKRAFGVTLCVQFISLFGLWALSTYASLVIAGAFFGLGLGGIAPLQAALLARGFGSHDFSRVMGLIGPLMIPFQVVGPPLAGWIFDTQGSYDLAIWIFMGTTLAGALVISFLHLPQAPRAAEA